jgi:hypothetical protein
MKSIISTKEKFHRKEEKIENNNQKEKWFGQRFFLAGVEFASIFIRTNIHDH